MRSIRFLASSTGNFIVPHIVFIYDESSSLQEHETTKKDLIKLEEIEDVIIVSKPSKIIKEDAS